MSDRSPLKDIRHRVKHLVVQAPRTYVKSRRALRILERNGALQIEIDSTLGFFAQLNWCVYILSYCIQHNVVPRFRLVGENLIDPGKGSDWFAYFFEMKVGAPASGTGDPSHPVTDYCRIHHIRDLSFLDAHIDSMTLELAHRLIEKYVAVRPEILRTIDDFQRRFFSGKRVLGVHYRGTDKALEAPRVAWERTEAVVRNCLADRQLKFDRVFVASDEERFVEYMHSRFHDVEVCSHADRERSRDDSPVHGVRSKGNRYVKGEEALINCLLLSRCQFLVRTSSFLSAWAAVFNPELPMVILNKPFDSMLWFPERELIRRSRDEFSRKDGPRGLVM